MNPKNLEVFADLDWCDYNLPDDFNEQDVIRSVARTARQEWNFPLRENGIVITHVDLHGPGAGWPAIVVAGPIEKMVHFIESYDNAEKIDDFDIHNVESADYRDYQYNCMLEGKGIWDVEPKEYDRAIEFADGTFYVVK